MLIAQGENPKYIQDQLGHASITTTFDTYGHLMPQARREASAKLANSLFEETLSEKSSRNVFSDPVWRVRSKGDWGPAADNQLDEEGIDLPSAFGWSDRTTLKPVAVKGLGDDVLMDRGAFGLDYVDLIIKKGNTIANRDQKALAVSEDLSPHHAELAVASGKPTSGLPVNRPQSSPGLNCTSTTCP
jgi:hypothetical protein